MNLLLVLIDNEWLFEFIYLFIDPYRSRCRVRNKIQKKKKRKEKEKGKNKCLLSFFGVYRVDLLLQLSRDFHPTVTLCLQFK